MVYRGFDKKAGNTIDTRTGTSPGTPDKKELAIELQRRITTKFERCKVQSSLQDNICWSCRHAVISKYNKGVRFMLCVIDIYSKYAWVILLSDKKILPLAMHFKKFLVVNQTRYGILAMTCICGEQTYCNREHIFM